MDIAPETDRHFKAIWNRICNTKPDSVITSVLIQQWANSAGLDCSAEEISIGSFVKVDAVAVKTGDARAFFPKIPFKRDPEWIARLQAMKANANLWEKVEWFCPLWVPMGEADKILTDARNRPRQQALELFDYHTSTLYTLPFQAICIAQILPQARSLRELAPLAREAFLAFYSGHRASSIAALIPAIEGSLSRLASNVSGDATLFVKIDSVIDRAIETAGRLHFGWSASDPVWVPPAYLTSEYLSVQDEVVFVLETFRRWLKASFFRDTGQYDGLTWLNRHMFAHGINASWQQPANFCRLVVALATMGFVESWHDETHIVSPFLPKMNDDSKLLWQQALLQADIQGRVKLMEQERYQKFGRLVPEMPTDDGVLLRKAILADDCVKDLVRPLRDAGWSVEIGEPEERALFVCVNATAREQNIRIALLYSCATDNDTYRRLAKDCDAILYRGAPYHQSSYAYGIEIHVGPVTGWQPPLAPRMK